MQKFFLNTDILLFDDVGSGLFRHVNLYPQGSAARTCSVGQTLCIPIGSVFGANFSPHNWEVFAQSRCKKNGALLVLSGLTLNSTKPSALVDLIKLPKDTDK